MKVTYGLNSLLFALSWLSSMCECNPVGLDLKIPRNAYLTAFYKRSFAHRTVSKRMPVILTTLIDGLVRSKCEILKEYGQQGCDDVLMVIGQLSKLKYEVQTNKPLNKLASNASDAQFYNDYIKERLDKDGSVTFFSTIWLLAECYMYRRIQEAFEFTDTLKEYDLFLKQKQDSFSGAEPMLSKFAEYLSGVLATSSTPEEEEFINLLKNNLWGNKCDLSLSNGAALSQTEELFDLEYLDKNILCDHSQEIWAALSNGSTGIIDNAGYEVFTDFCLADYLISKKLATTVRFYVKTIPWFISDVMSHDFYWTINHMRFSIDRHFRELGDKWFMYIKNKTWVVVEHEFWTLPVDFTYMQQAAPSLYKQLAEAKLVIFKGDLNYRKLFGERNWDPTTPVTEALQNFHPTKICSLRAVKSDIICGLAEGLAEKIEAIDDKWMETGDYGLIQFSDKIISGEENGSVCTPCVC